MLLWSVGACCKKWSDHCCMAVYHQGPAAMRSCRLTADDEFNEANGLLLPCVQEDCYKDRSLSKGVISAFHTISG